MALALLSLRYVTHHVRSYVCALHWYLIIISRDILHTATTDNYRAHTSCISEAERYEKTAYRGPKKGDMSKTKKLSPQEAWNCLVAGAVETAPLSIRPNMERLAMLDNVPRKQKQFRNFTANSLKLRGRDAEVVDAMWAHLSKLKEEELATKAEQEVKNVAKKEKQDASDKEEKGGGMEMKRAASETKPSNDDAAAAAVSDGSSTNEEKATPTPHKIEAKKVNKAMKKVIKKVPRNKMKMRELRQKVMSRMKLKQSAEQELRKAIEGQIDANPKKFKLDGKFVLMLK